MRRIIISLTIGVMFFSAVDSGGGQVQIRENFTSLSDWAPLHFPKIRKHTRYTIVTEGGRSVLKAEAEDSASGLVYKMSFDVFKTPMMKWKWRISNVYNKGDEKTKSGDDYPIRVYVVFEYDPSRLAAAERMKYGAARLLYGTYPPDSSLNYIWANKMYPERILTSPYSEKSMMILLQKGSVKAGLWVEEKVNILQDYREAFGTDPPRKAGLAIMSDADNTGEKATAHVEFIEIYGFAE